MGSDQINIKEVVEQGTLTYTVSKTYLITKRLFDTALSLFAVILFVPLFLIIAAAIFLESPGPILLVQTRFGLMGKPFKLFKFRSRVVNSESLFGAIEAGNEAYVHTHKTKHDPCETHVGRIIRRTGIGELLQLFNVLKGDMSFVGPCPSEPCELGRYDAWHKLRMSVRPGMTGLWQISGRNKTDFDMMAALDLKYIRERSFMYDIRILFKTLCLLLGFKG